jgi:MFS family permease
MSVRNSLRRVSEFLALRRNTSLLLVALLLAGTGEKLWLGFAPKYIETLGGSVFIIGLFDALQTFLGAIYAYPGGWLTDRWGQRKSLLLFSAISVAGYILVLLWPHWLALLLGSFLFLAWSALSLPTTFSVVATSLEKSRHTMGIGVQSMVRRVPMMLGPLIGGWLLTRFGWTDGVRYALALCIAMSLLTAAFQWFMFEPDQPRGSRGNEAHTENSDGASSRRLLQDEKIVAPTFFSVVKSFTPGLKELLVSDILIRFCERIPYAFIILWAMDSGGVTAQQFGYLVAFEMVTAMLCYIPVAHLADKYGRRPFVLITFVFFTLFPVTLLWAHNFAWLALAFVVRGLKEFGEPARKALIIGEAAPELRARTYGAYYLIRDCTVTSGSFLGAWLWHVSPRANFIGAAVCGALGTIWFWWFIYRKKNLRNRVDVDKVHS